MRKKVWVLLVFSLGCVDLNKLPPTAGPMLIISPSQNYGAFPLTVSFVIQAIPSRGVIKNLFVDWGDGTQEDIKDKLKDNRVVLSKTYERLGVFYVRLYGMDDSGSSEAETVIITNDAPKIEEFSAYRDEFFLEPSSNFIPGDTVYVKALCLDMNGISTVMIDWGDGEVSETDKCQGSHRYVMGGDYTIRIIVYDANRFAPYPLSSSQTIQISVFEGASSSENIPPFISLSYEYVENGLILTDEVFGKVPMEVGVVIGVADLDSGLNKIFVDWGDGEASPILLQQAIAKSGERYIFKLSHKYKKEGKFKISVIAEDMHGMRQKKDFGPISVVKQAPVMYAEAKDLRGNNIDGGTFPSPLTIKIRTFSFDVAGPYYIYMTIAHTKAVEGYKEYFIKMLVEAEDIYLFEWPTTLTSPGTYTLTLYAVPKIEDIEIFCRYCTTSSSKINSNLVCDEEEFNSVSSCELYSGNLKNAKVKIEKTFSFSIQ